MGEGLVILLPWKYLVLYVTHLTLSATVVLFELDG